MLDCTERHRKQTSMIVTLHAGVEGSAPLTARETDNLKALSVDGPPSMSALAAVAVAGGDVDPKTISHVMLDIEQLRALGPGTGRWNDDFNEMIAYAQRNGWLSDDRKLVRAHISWPAPRT
jgi:hypothetical protein